MPSSTSHRTCIHLHPYIATVVTSTMGSLSHIPKLNALVEQRELAARHAYNAVTSDPEFDSVSVSVRGIVNMDANSCPSLWHILYSILPTSCLEYLQILDTI